MDAHVTTAELRQSLASATPPLLIDVRRREAFLQSGLTLPGALRRDPERVADWVRELPAAGAVVVYCVHGHEVSQGVAATLRAQGRELAPQCAGLAAVSLGLSRRFADDHEMLARGMTVYDALYAWCKDGKSEVHTWNPAAYR